MPAAASIRASSSSASRKFLWRVRDLQAELRVRGHVGLEEPSLDRVAEHLRDDIERHVDCPWAEQTTWLSPRLRSVTPASLARASSSLRSSLCATNADKTA